MLHEDLELFNQTANSFGKITSEGQTVGNVIHNNLFLSNCEID